MIETLDPQLLARIQFAANISFHILFPSISIALCWVLVYFQWMFRRSGEKKWRECYGHYVKIFALSFAFGVVSGVTMSFQFGTNWPGYMNTVGNIAGPLLAYEILTAFFLEAAFLGIMLFGMSRAPGWLHTLSTWLVAIGTTVSAFWIIALNSWMQTPAGFEMRDGVAHATDWLSVIFNPSMPYRLTHMLMASGLTAAFLVAGTSALQWWRGDTRPAVLAAMQIGTTVAAVLIPAQMFVGDQHGLNTLHHQPAKIAAMEANWKTQARAPLILFAYPDEVARDNRYEISIPGVASLILAHSLDGVVPGLDDFKGSHPPVAPVFYGFRVMVGTGVLMLVVSWFAVFHLRRKREPGRLVLLLLIAMTYAGWVATLAGWYVTEIGRQPWLVTGILKTADAASNIPAPSVLSSLIMYLLTYAGLLAAFVAAVFHIGKKTPPAEEPNLTMAMSGKRN
jgi:cytochrome d ubiquinol oxidase subunit I